jgi:hypothetical protein
MTTSHTNKNPAGQGGVMRLDHSQDKSTKQGDYSMNAGRMQATITTVRLVALLSVIKQSYPARLSTNELRDALSYIGYQYHTRTIQRHLKDYAVVGLIEGDKEMPKGWRLTQSGKELLGVQS